MLVAELRQLCIGGRTERMTCAYTGAAGVFYSQNFAGDLNVIENVRRSPLTGSILRKKWTIATVKMEAADDSETSASR